MFLRLAVNWIKWNLDIFPSGHSPQTATNAHVSTYFHQSLGASVIITHIRLVGFYVKTEIIHQLKRLCVPDCTYMESMLINFILYISLYHFSHANHFILTQKRRGCMKKNRMPPAYAVNLEANSGNTIYGVRVLDQEARALTINSDNHLQSAACFESLPGRPNVKSMRKR